VYVVLRRLIPEFTLVYALAKEHFLRLILASKKTILEISLIVLSSLKQMLLLVLDVINGLLSSFK
jgi:hypothetical protein